MVYTLYEVFPCKYGNMYRSLLVFDNKSDAKDVIHLLEDMNYLFTCYIIMKTPYKWRIV